MSRRGALARLAKTAATIEPGELRPSLVSFGVVFMLMSAYYTLRPVRDSLASDWSDATLSALWTFTFLFSFAATAVYGLAASRVRLRRLAPSVYGFFAATFVAMYLFAGAGRAPELVDKMFYVWVSVYALFQVSVFWSLMADLFGREQSKRLFGFITTGASIGAIAGPAIPALLAGALGNAALLLIASLTLCATIPLIIHLESLRRAGLGNPSGGDAPMASRGLGGDPLAGFRLFLRTPYLLGIGAFIFLFTGIGSFVYFELKNLLADFPVERRTRIWALIDLATNSLGVLAGLFVTSRLAQRLGLAFTLALVPAAVAAGLLAVAAAPLAWLVAALQVLRRAGNYGVTRPAREMLFTAVDREARFKAKQVIDVVVYRGGDVFWAWSFTGLTAVLGLGMAGVALVGAALAALWAALAVHLGRQFASRAPGAGRRWRLSAARGGLASHAGSDFSAGLATLPMALRGRLSRKRKRLGIL